MKKILFILIAFLTLTQCEEKVAPIVANNEFLKKTEVGLYSEANPVYVHNIDNHQTSVAKLPKYQFVMQTDDQTAYFRVIIDNQPSALNEDVQVDIKAVGVADFKNGVYAMRVVKINKDRIWLWAATEKIGAIVAPSVY